MLWNSDSLDSIASFQRQNMNNSQKQHTVFATVTVSAVQNGLLQRIRSQHGSMTASGRGAAEARNPWQDDKVGGNIRSSPFSIDDYRPSDLPLGPLFRDPFGDFSSRFSHSGAWWAPLVQWRQGPTIFLVLLYYHDDLIIL
jgi:hypothetical protein